MKLKHWSRFQSQSLKILCTYLRRYRNSLVIILIVPLIRIEFVIKYVADVRVLFLQVCSTQYWLCDLIIEIFDWTSNWWKSSKFMLVLERRILVLSGCLVLRIVLGFQLIFLILILSWVVVFVLGIFAGCVVLILGSTKSTSLCFVVLWRIVGVRWCWVENLFHFV